MIPVPYKATVAVVSARSYGRKLFAYVIRYASGRTAQTFGFTDDPDVALREGRKDLAWQIRQERKRDKLYGRRQIVPLTS